MKRLLIRMSALAAVVVLGMIAIAQAQRGMEDRPPETETSRASGSAPADEGASKPIAGRATPADVPGLFPEDSGINPLRSAGSDPAPREVVPASTGFSDRYSTGADAAGNASPHETAATQATDAIAVVAAVGGGDENEQFATAVDGSPHAPLDNAGRYDPRVGATRYPRLGNPGQPYSVTGSAARATPAEPGSAQPLGGDGYGDGITSAGDSREPGKLELDPEVPVSSLPDVPNSRADGFALPGTRPLPDESGVRIEGTGTPGNKQLEGPQTPQLTIQKSAPDEMQVGKEASFRVKVTNTGQIAAHGVEVRDEIPKGTRLVSTSPRASRDARGGLVWSLDTLQPGEEAAVELRVMPEEEGEIGSVATVCFNADASARAIATKPELAIQTSAPSQVLIGEEFTLTITLSNPGSGVAYDVVLEDHVPPGLRHAAGDELEYAVGNLKPKESRQLELTLSADGAGRVTNVLTARADANLKIEDRVDIEVTAPQLEVALDGPKRRYLEREATYALSVSNPGTAPARNVELIAHLPPGLEFVNANNAGQYDAVSRTVHWQLEELPVQETGMVRLTTVPKQAGEQTLRFVCAGEPGLSVQGEQPILVEGIADISFQVVDVEDPIEVGGETTYEIRVVNRGSKAATNLQLVAIIPPGMRAIAAEGQVRHVIEANRVIFESLPRLADKADTTYRVRVQGLQPGDLRLSVQLLTDEMSAPVTKEESTRVYSDE